MAASISLVGAAVLLSLGAAALPPLSRLDRRQLQVDPRNVTLPGCPPPPAPEGWSSMWKYCTFARNPVFRRDVPFDQVRSDPSSIPKMPVGGDQLIPLDRMKELSECAKCQEDAPALSRIFREVGMASDYVEEWLKKNVCQVPGVLCVEIDEKFAAGGDKQGYFIFLTGRDIPDVPVLLVHGPRDQEVQVDVTRLKAANGMGRGRRRYTPLPKSFYDLRAVMGLVVQSFSLAGRLDEAIGKVQSLRLLYFERTSLMGPLPANLTTLSHLQGLYLMESNFSGPLPPSLPDLKNLQVLKIDKTRIEGSLPYDMGRLKNLRILTVTHNPHMDGPALPQSLTECTNLTHIRLDGFPGGQVPLSIGSLKRLRLLSVPRCNLTGGLPPSLANMRALRYIDLSQNRLMGRVPDELGTRMDQLVHINLQNNSLSGPLPASLGSAANLKFIFLSHQADQGFQGPIPEAWGNLSRLRTLEARNNDLSGPLPGNLSGMASLMRLDIRENRLSGTLDPLSPLKSLMILHFDDNQFEGGIPSAFANFTELLALSGDKNKISKIPLYLDNLRSLRSLRLRSNSLSGVLPSLAPLRSLEVLQLNDNDIERYQDIDDFPISLKVLDLSGNRLRSLPYSWLELPQLRSLRVARNQVSRLPAWGHRGICKGTDGAIVDVSAANYPDLERVSSFWPNLREVDMSDNPLDMSVNDLMAAFKTAFNLEVLEASNCGLSGRLTCEALYYTTHSSIATTTPSLQSVMGYTNLAVLDLHGNLIQSLDTFPARLLSLYRADFRNNRLTTIVTPSNSTSVSQRAVSILELGAARSRQPWSWSWLSIDQVDLTGNPELRLPSVERLNIQSCEELYSRRVMMERSGQVRKASVVADPLGYARRRQPNGAAVFECTHPCWNFNLIQVDDTVNEAALCRCERGYFGVGRDCAKCPANTYSNAQVGTERCLPCSSGQVSVAGSSKCVCDRGFTLSGSVCSPCGKGSYKELVGSGECTRCPDDKFTSLPNSTSLDDCFCHSNYIRHRHLTQCSECPRGLDCEAPIRFHPPVQSGFYQLMVDLDLTALHDSSDSSWRQLRRRQGGHWKATGAGNVELDSLGVPLERGDQKPFRTMSSYDAGVTSLPVVVECPVRKACKGSDLHTGQNICMTGQSGFVCGSCDEGFARMSNLRPCGKCPPAWQNVMTNLCLFAITLLAIFGWTILAQRGAHLQRAAPHSMLLKMAQNHFSAVSGLAMVVSTDWPVWSASLVEDVFAWEGGVPVAYSAWECLLRPAWGPQAVMFRHAVWIILPLVWLIIVTAVAALIIAIKTGYLKRLWHTVQQWEVWQLSTWRRWLNWLYTRLTRNSRRFASIFFTRNGFHSHSPDDHLTDATHSTHCSDHYAIKPAPPVRKMTSDGDIGGSHPPSPPPELRRSASSSSRIMGLFDVPEWSPDGRVTWQSVGVFLAQCAPLWIATITLIHPTVTKSMLELLRCRRMPYLPTEFVADPSRSPPVDTVKDTLRSRLLLSPSLLCFQDDHRIFAWMGTFGLCFWGIAPIILCFVVLWAKRASLYRPSTQERYGFLYTGLRRPFFFWDCVFAVRRVAVLTISQLLDTSAALLLGSTSIAVLSLALQLLFQPFEARLGNTTTILHRHFDMANRLEFQGLGIWTVSCILMQVVVLFELSPSIAGSIIFLVAIMNMYHYASLLYHIFRHSFAFLAYKYIDEKEERSHIFRLFLRVCRPIMKHIIRQEERRRASMPKVFLDYPTGTLNLLEPADAGRSPISSHCTSPRSEAQRSKTATPTATLTPPAFPPRIMGGDGDDHRRAFIRYAQTAWCHVVWAWYWCVGKATDYVREVRAVVARMKLREHRAKGHRTGALAMQMTGHAMADAIELLSIRQELPGDFAEFLWTTSFLVHALRIKTMEDHDSKMNRTIVMPIPESATAVPAPPSRMSTRKLPDAAPSIPENNPADFKSMPTMRSTTGLSEGTSLPPFTFDRRLRSAGVALHDFQLNLSYVVDDLLRRQQIAEGLLQQQDTDGGSTLEGAEGVGDWRTLYESFRRAKRSLIQAGTNPREVSKAIRRIASNTALTSSRATDELTVATPPLASNISRSRSFPNPPFTPAPHTASAGAVLPSHTEIMADVEVDSAAVDTLTAAVETFADTASGRLRDPFEFAPPETTSRPESVMGSITPPRPPSPPRPPPLRSFTSTPSMPYSDFFDFANRVYRGA
ncbi:unnamed protein product [Vitrella brassicaformis CCMP3155]|uniref:EGF-like domain-containing protein n=6 Tax=Vitrella brassicaformis TaxID=1169539 RepID=A0A0G4EP32_VITBC|nr:unnamed protein product [Vitrella brassicaformis CCMP3155]|eukprot:CEL99184.1 unnamed protein product [Vitrella brassicaformis CCMP3155]